MEEQQENFQPQPTPKKEGSVGAIVGTLIVVILLVLAAFYFWNSSVIAPTQEQQINNQPATSTNQTNLELEIENFDEFENVEDELKQIQADIEAEFNSSVN